MESKHIEVGQGTRLSQGVRTLVSSTRSVSNQAREILAICDEYLGADPDLDLDETYQDLAIALDMTGEKALVKTKKFYALLVNAQARFEGNQISNFVNRLG